MNYWNKITVISLVGVMIYASFIGGYFLSTWANHRASASGSNDSDILYLSCDSLDIRINTFYNSANHLIASNPTEANAISRQAELLEQIYNNQGCYANQNQTAPAWNTTVTNSP